MFLLPLAPFLVSSDGAQITRCGDLLAKLAQEARIVLDVPNVLAEHRVYLNRRETAPLVMIKSIAKACGATLVRTEKGYTIERTSTDLAEIVSRREAEHQRWIEKRLKSVTEFRERALNGGRTEGRLSEAFHQDLQAWEDLTQGKRTGFPMNTGNQLLPSAVLLEELARRVGFSTLAKIPDYETRIYENVPARFALSLPKCDDLLDAYRRENERLVSADVAGAITKEVARAGLSGLFEGLPQNPSRASRLRLQCDSYDNGVNLVLEVYDARGFRVDTARLFAGPGDDLSTAESFTRQESQRPDSHWIALSIPARQAVESLAGALDKAPEWFAEPVAQEPLDLFVCEAVSGLLKDGQKPVVFDVSDTFWGLVRGCVVRGRLNLDALRQALGTWLPYRRLSLDGVTVCRPLGCEASEARRADRKALRRFVNAPFDPGWPDPRTTSLLIHDASPTIGALASTWLSIARRCATPVFGSDPPLLVYALLGAVPSPEWNDLKAGKTLSVKRLGIGLQLRRFFETSAGLPVQGNGQALPDLYKHPLELYASEELGSTPIGLRLTREPVIRFWRSSEKENPFWSLMEGTGNLFGIPPIFFRQREGKIVCLLKREDYEQKLGLLTFRRGARDVTKLVIGLPQNCQIVEELPSSVTPEPKPFAYRDLPPSVRGANWQKALADGIAQAERDAKAPPAPGGAAAPPAVPR